mmetsp:Transcript_15033/g.20470  ORF Transcript_15033/g.20470 Transcript_15033/m.20470 type:complete len:203 (+) Transcript_15033:584-1192(+)
MDSLNSRVNTPDTTFSEHGLCFLAVVVSVKDDPPVLFECRLGNVKRILASINTVGELSELLSNSGIKNGVNQRNILCRPDSTELKASTTVWEWGCTVTIFGRNLEWKDLTGAKVEILDSWVVCALALTVLEVLKVESHIVTKISGYNSGWCLASTQTEIITRRSNSHTHKVSMNVNSGNDSCHDDSKGVVVSSGGVDVLGAE